MPDVQKTESSRAWCFDRIMKIDAVSDGSRAVNSSDAIRCSLQF